MKNALFISIALLFFASCNNSENEQKIRTLSAKDSTLLKEVIQRDSAITSDIRLLNDIQDNIDSIKRHERMLFMANEDKAGNNTVSDIKAIDRIIINNKREINRLEFQLKKQKKKDADLEKMIARLTSEVNDKENEIVEMQSKYSTMNDTLRSIIRQFNDSITVIEKQRQSINEMTTAAHTVYYAIGTTKELKKQGVISKEGGIIGIGSVAQLKSDFNTEYFTRGNMQQLHVLPLYNKYVKLITNHPGSSYKVTNNGRSDTLVITDPNAFWANTKYMVVVVK